jgi:tetratricopeptide (TPR) repeat protein
LAELLYAKGDYDGAGPLYQRALAISERAFGSDHPDTASVRNNLAGLLRHMGKIEEARELELKHLDIITNKPSVVALPDDAAQPSEVMRLAWRGIETINDAVEEINRMGGGERVDSQRLMAQFRDGILDLEHAAAIAVPEGKDAREIEAFLSHARAQKDAAPQYLAVWTANQAIKRLNG